MVGPVAVVANDWREWCSDSVVSAGPVSESQL